MSFGLDLNLSVGLEQKLSPQMIQSLKLLQMNALELEMVVKQELESNPLLEIPEEGEVEAEADAEDGITSEGLAENEKNSEKETVDQSTTSLDNDVSSTGADGEELGGDRERSSSQEFEDLGTTSSENLDRNQEIDWESYLEDGFDLGDRRSEELDSPDERFEKVPVYSKSLQDHLLGQLQDRHLPEGCQDLVEYLIHSLDDRGWLTATASAPEVEKGDDADEDDQDEWIGTPPPHAVAAKEARQQAEAAKVAALVPKQPDRPEIAEIQAIIEGMAPLENASLPVREAFHVLHSLEPAGIGARNLRECLLLQIQRNDHISPLAKAIVENAFELLEKLKIAALAKKFEVTPEQIQTAVKAIGTLEPHPGRLLGASTATPVTPDLLVEEVEGQLVLMLNDRSVPSLRISRAYANLLKKGSRASTDEKKYVREKLNSATWLIRAIEQRKGTMLKVMGAIMEAQPEFFTKGPTHLKPLILQDVADRIGMHISTVSRVTNGKYVQTLHGIYELKYFFSAGVTQSDGSEVSSVAAKDEIKRLIDAEDSRRPLSDQKIVEILKTKGLDVARRTVAKYRDQLEILPARLRKQY